VRKYRSRWKGNNEINLREFVFEHEERIHVTQNRWLRQAHVNMQMKIRDA